MQATCFEVRGLSIRLAQCDITEADTEAIVNAANSYLKHGGGVALAIVRKGGDVIQRESDEWVKRYGPVPEGEVAVTGAGKLKAKYVIHAVGPKYGDPLGDEKLARAISNSLLKAEELGLKSIALPAISTGVFGYPYRRCAEIMADVFLATAGKLKSLRTVLVCLWGSEAYEAFRSVFLEKLRDYISSCP
ncbi:ADP-ribose-binding protein [Thermofilum pendens]|uniref:Appr-1-p processing domain protein n=1 Tax=Thermofilum pendens (strain DSM 2475 / Hrk 5) TaxID=368408 RepID=A1RWM4_THEPD|nr:ADP-ribose-binding protein [Thermofilum pendens]ABL77604.1 Appr-1-p processing domain protein [Thermofilum pendens Hrk 5]